MKKKLYIAAAFAVLATFFSCQRERIDKDIVVENALVFTADIDGVATKTTIDGVKVKWTETDKISINGISYTAHPDSTDLGKASFTKDSGDNPESPYVAVYPSSLYVASPSPHYALPAGLTYSDGEFNIPMYAESETTSLTFKNIFAVLKVSVPDTVSVLSIEVSSDLYMNGNFTVNEDVASITGDTDASKTTTLTCNPAVTGRDFYIPVPAGVYSGKNLKVVLTKNDGTKETMTTKQSTNVEIAAGTIYSFNFKKDGLFVLGPLDKTITDKLKVL